MIILVDQPTVILRNRATNTAALAMILALSAGVPFLFPPLIPPDTKVNQLGASLAVSFSFWVFWSVGPGVSFKVSSNILLINNWVLGYQVPFEQVERIYTVDGISILLKSGRTLRSSVSPPSILRTLLCKSQGPVREIEKINYKNYTSSGLILVSRVKPSNYFFLAFATVAATYGWVSGS